MLQGGGAGGHFAAVLLLEVRRALGTGHIPMALRATQPHLLLGRWLQYNEPHAQTPPPPPLQPAIHRHPRLLFRLDRFRRKRSSSSASSDQHVSVPHCAPRCGLGQRGLGRPAGGWQREAKLIPRGTTDGVGSGALGGTRVTVFPTTLPGDTLEAGVRCVVQG
uniref:Secreted protein n=1 Tax=Ixodes ricinus TaxID=34613 RepID=A0A6B0UXW6_IXORI